MPQSWPSELPQRFSKDGYSDSFADNRIATNPDLGPALIRSRVSSMPRPVTGVMVMSRVQLERLRKFWKTDTLDGKLPFIFPDPTFGFGSAWNYIPYSGNTGATTDPTPGTLPTGWSGLGMQNGIYKEVVGAGVESGLEYVDVHFSGVGEASAAAEISFVSAATARAGETWVLAANSRLVGGSKTNVTLVGMHMYDSPTTVSSGLTNFLTSISTDSLINQRYATKAWRIPTPGATGIRPFYRVTGKVGLLSDITLRIAAPQLEKGTSAATRYIPTPNTGRPTARFAGGPPSPSFLGGDAWSVNINLEIFEV